jgi:hypothetical protein
MSGPCPHCGYLPVPKDREFYIYPKSEVTEKSTLAKPVRPSKRPAYLRLVRA